MLTRYLNTDLDIESKTDLSALTDDLWRRKWVVLHSGQHDDGVWRASFEHLWNSEAGAEQAIAGMLDVLERLPGHLKTIWTAGQKRDTSGFRPNSGRILSDRRFRTSCLLASRRLVPRSASRSTRYHDIRIEWQAVEDAFPPSS